MGRIRMDASGRPMKKDGGRRIGQVPEPYCRAATHVGLRLKDHFPHTLLKMYGAKSAFSLMPKIGLRIFATLCFGRA